MASKSKLIAELLDASGDVLLGNLDNVPASNDASALTTGTLPIARIADGDITNAKLADTVNRGRRNVLINGGMNICQRATSFTYTGGIWVYGGPDRWAGHFDGPPTGATRHQFGGGPSGVGSSHFVELRGGTSGGNGSAYLSQRIESQNLQGIRDANTATVSGWVKRSGSANSTFSVNMICPTATDNYGSYTTHGGVFTDNETISGDGTVGSSSFTLTTVDTWYYFSATVPNFNSKTNADKGMQLYFAVGGLSTTSDKYQFTQIQLEAGTEATPFEHRSVREEQTDCERYFEVGGSSQRLTGSIHRVAIPYRTQKRTNATYVVYYGTTERLAETSPGTINRSNSTNSGWNEGGNSWYGNMEKNAGSETSVDYLWQFTASAEL